jgi:hypothetical protein
MIKIKITPEIEAEIRREMQKANATIIGEMSYSVELRNYSLIIARAQFIADMLKALNAGEI